MKGDQADASLEKRLAKLQEVDPDNFERLLQLLILRIGIELEFNQRTLDPEIIGELRGLEKTIVSQRGRNDKLVLDTLLKGLKIIGKLNPVDQLSVPQRQ